MAETKGFFTRDFGSTIIYPTRLGDSIQLKGLTSGSVNLIVPSVVGGDYTLTLPSATGTVSLVGHTQAISTISDATTAGQNILKLTNPSAITFLRINANNTVDALNASDFRTAIGAGTLSIGSTANLPVITTTGGVLTTGSFGTAINTFCQGNDSRLSDSRTPVAHNQAVATISDATTVGQNLVKLTNPSTITFIRINADNTISALSDSAFRTAIGAGSSTFDGTWGSLSGKPANVVSIGSLANATGWLHNDGAGVFAYSTPTAANVGAEASGAVATHAALTTGVHGLAITVGQTLTVTTGGTLGTAAYTASSAYAAVAQTMYIGTTSVAINRGSGTLNLAGIGTLGVGAITTTGVLTLPNSNTLTGNSGYVGFSGGLTTINNVGIGVASPSVRLNVVAPTGMTQSQNFVIFNDGIADRFQFQADTGSGSTLYINSGMTIIKSFSVMRLYGGNNTGIEIGPTGTVTIGNLSSSAISVGANDSGGTGYKLLRVPN